MRKLETVRMIVSGMLITGLILILSIVSCKREPLVYTVSSNTNITAYLDQNPEKYSEFRKILSRSETADFLQAYGKYTLFLPNNEAVKLYLNQIGKTSVEDVDIEALKDLVKFHVIDDTISTKDFGDGKIGTRTMFGQYLTTGAVIRSGETKLLINKQGAVEAANIRVGNGIIHEVDRVLTPATKTLAQLIESNPSYSIFTKALKETGLYDTLNVLPAANGDKWFTVLVQTDSVFKAAKYDSFEALKTRFSKNGTDPKTIADSLNVFVRYHILPGVKYLADIGSGTSHTTKAPSEILQSKVVNRQVLINDIRFEGVDEVGLLLDKSRSDISASNGALHTTAPYESAAGKNNGHLEVKVRKPSPVYWDVADFPEVRALPSVFRKASVRKYFPRTSDAVSPIAGWWWPNKEASTAEKYGINYCTPGGISPGGAAVPSQNKNFVYGDYLGIPLGVATAANPGSATNAWLQMRTPVIVKGKYKVWICYERREQTGKWPTGRRTQCQVKVDDAILTKPFDFAEPPPVGTHAELESQGWKYYTNDPTRATLAAPTANVLIGKLVGIVEIKSTDTHTIRLDVIQGNSNTDILDMIHFIPVDAPSQILPRFRPDGSQDFSPITP